MLSSGPDTKKQGRERFSRSRPCGDFLLLSGREPCGAMVPRSGVVSTGSSPPEATGGRYAAPTHTCRAQSATGSWCLVFSFCYRLLLEPLAGNPLTSDITAIWHIFGCRRSLRRQRTNILAPDCPKSSEIIKTFAESLRNLSPPFTSIGRRPAELGRDAPTCSPPSICAHNM
jgi:hypothetical protein